MTIHNNLKELRKAKGLTQEQVAQQIGLTRQALSSYESGRTRPDVETLMKLAEIYSTDLDGILYGQEKRQKAARRIRVAAGITFVLLSLLTAVSSALLWIANRFFPMTEGQISPEEMILLETRMRLTGAWEFTDGLLLHLPVLAFLLLLLLLVTAPGTYLWKSKILYAGALAAALVVLPLPFGLTDPIFPLSNYLFTPLFVILRLGVFLALDLVIEAFLEKRKR
ncbi:MAG: helix-turn-helix transcriptional regulator [Ruminiclostridium sp.]|nr:helix-turn-helix transcriptional regulator [Ruminiclostridium sp.]